jgi:hypothetical protein
VKNIRSGIVAGDVQTPMSYPHEFQGDIGI